MTRRRDLLAIGAVGAAALAVPSILRRQGPQFQPIPGAQGFYGAPMARRVDPLVGLDAPDLPAIDLCATVFRASRAPHAAFFSDHRCPNCPRAAAALKELARQVPGLTIVWHEWPIFGGRSQMLARLAVAARAQGTEIHSALYTANGPAARIAGTLGLGPSVLADMDSPRTTAHLVATTAAAAWLGLIGTPSVVLNGTVLVGAKTTAQMAQALEMTPSPCAA